MYRIQLQPEWDLIQRKIGALNFKQGEFEFWCYQPWPDTDQTYKLTVVRTSSGNGWLLLEDQSMGIILDFLDIMQESGVSDDTILATRKRLLRFCTE